MRGTGSPYRLEINFFHHLSYFPYIGSTAGWCVSLLLRKPLSCSRLMDGAQRRTESGWHTL
jgi:hypothetical protein